MLTLLRRVFLLALLAGGGYAAWTAWQRRNETVPSAPEWPPMQPAAAAPPSTTTEATEAPVATATATSASQAEVEADEPAPAEEGIGDAAPVPDWVEPVDGTCPVSHPIKANDNSKIFHLPGGRFYDRTAPERCYATEDAAVRDGYRAAKT